MKYLPILAGSHIELQAFIRANPWLNPFRVFRVFDRPSLQAIDRGQLLLALPGWEGSPTVESPRSMLQMIHERHLQLVVLENASYCLRDPEPATEIDDESPRAQALGQNGNGGERHCVGCGSVWNWTLDNGQQALLGNNRQTKKSRP